MIVRRLPFEGGEGVVGLFKEASDRVGHHVGLFCCRCRAETIKDCNDGNEGNCVGKGKLRVLNAFGDLSESIGSRDGNSVFGRLFCVQFELDFNFLVSEKGRKSPII
jgi:hypothetical protein